MREGWTYKKLGEVATFMSGYTPDKDNVLSHGDYPYYKVAEMNMPGNELYMRNTSFFVNSPKKVFPKDSIVFPKNGGAIYTEKKRILEYNSVIDLNTEALVPNNNVALMYLFYYLTFSKISKFDKGGGLPSLDLKKMSDSLIPIPPLSEQQAIVSRLDAAFAKIDALKANAEKQLAEARALFQKALTEAMTPKDGWEKKRLKKLAAKLFAGGDVPKESFSKTQTPQYCIPIVSNGIENNGLYGYTEFARVNEPAVTISGRGTIGYIVERKSPFFPIIRLITIIPHLEIIGTRFLYYALRNIDFSHSGSSIPQLTVPMVKDLEILLPPLSEQQAIVSRLDALSENVRRYEEIQRKTITECDALKQALLREIFEE